MRVPSRRREYFHQTRLGMAQYTERQTIFCDYRWRRKREMPVVRAFGPHSGLSHGSTFDLGECRRQNGQKGTSGKNPVNGGIPKNRKTSATNRVGTQRLGHVCPLVLELQKHISSRLRSSVKCHRHGRNNGMVHALPRKDWRVRL